MLQIRGRSARLRDLLLLGVIIRIIFVPFFAHPFDMNAWYLYIDKVIQSGVSLSIIGINPIWNLVLVFDAYVYNFLSSILHISVIPVSNLPANFDPSYGITSIMDPLFNTIVKIPFIVADIFSALLIYRIVYFHTKDSVISWRTSAIFYLSPIVIWISGAWGQYDSLPVFFTLLAFYFLLVKNRTFLSSFSLTIAVLIKIYPIIFLVPIIISILRFESGRIKKLAIYLMPFLPLFIYGILFQQSGVVLLIQGMLTQSEIFFINGFGLTYWSISLILPIDIFWASIIRNIVLVSLILVSIHYIVFRAKTRYTVIVFGSLLFTIALFLSLFVVTEQRSIILLALLSLVTIKIPSMRKYVIILSFAAFLYAQKNFPFYLLPIAAKFPDIFSFLFSYASQFVQRSPEFISPTLNMGVILFIIGASFSALLVIIVYRIFRFDEYQNING
jgi:Gpi18-like mannosyltransferase|tara:strand:+ start:3537 stop:4868 length:1332 start_codon:yes stop_codon:yes gene_type:complete